MNTKELIKKIVIFILTLEAKLALRKYKPKIIVITGSVGKTSAKDAIYTALLPFSHVRKSAKSWNSDIGIPLTILGLPNAWNDAAGWLSNIARGFLLLVRKNNYPKWLVLEVGADHPGEIERVMRWIRPNISVATRIGEVPVHVEHYRSVKDLIREKSFLARGVKPEGFLILNADDKDVMSFKEFSSAEVITFGATEPADVKASYIRTLYNDSGKPEGISFKIDIAGASIPISLRGILGRTHVYPVLSAFAVGKALALNPLEAQSVFADYEYPRGRMNILSGINDSTLIDDSYNASPVAMEEAFRATEELKASGKKIAVLGDMLELGRFSSEEHARLGALAGGIFNVLILVGIRAKEMKEPATKAGLSKKSIFVFQNSGEAGEFLRSFLASGDLVLIKGSQGMRMERAVEIVMEHKELKAKLLVRQEPEWLAKK